MFEKLSDHCPWLNYKKRLLLRCIHHFKSDLINNMDHNAYFLVLNPRKLSLAKQCNLKKLESDVSKVPKQVETKRYGEINTQNDNFNYF